MTSGIAGAGGDLDLIFAARSTAKRADVGIQVAGSDISNRYEKYVSGTKASATGISAAGLGDLNNVFAPPSTSGPVNPNFQSMTVNGVAQAGIVSCTITLSTNSNGSWTETGIATLSGNQNLSGSWYLPNTTGIGSGYTVQYIWTPTATPTGMSVGTSGSGGPFALSSNQAFSATMTGSPAGNKTYAGTLQIIIRNTGGTIVGNNTVTFTLNAH